MRKMIGLTATGQSVASNTQQDLDQALNHLAKQDSVFKKALKSFGIPKSRSRPSGFATLAKIIVGQQISTHAADAIWRRLTAALASTSAPNVLTTPDQTLRDAGLSANKVKTLKAIAKGVRDRDIVFRSFHSKSDEEIRTILTNVWGIGDWTADIYLMFAMNRPDVWPAGDLALRTGWQIITKAPDRVEANELARRAELWSPHRSAAAVFLWHAVAVGRAN